MIGFLALLLINAILFVASTVLAPKPHFDDAIPDDPKGPRSQEGDVIPVVFGTARIAANVTAFTAPSAVSETQKIKTGVFSSSTVTTGYSYEAFLHAFLCHGPIDALLDIIFQDSKSLADGSTDTVYEPTGEDGIYAPVTTEINYTTPALPVDNDAAVGGKSLDVNAPDLFGGYQHGGGVFGPVRVYWGLVGQTADPTLDEMFSQALSDATGATADGRVDHFVPNYERMAHVVFGVSDHSVGGPGFQRFNFGESGQVPPLYFVVRRCPSNLGLDATITNINGGANPAEVVYECLINTVWGAGVPTNQIDQASFIAAANTLAAEGFGFNLSLTSAQPLDTVVTEVMRYIDGQLQQDPITGLLELTLNRNDYVVADIPLIDESNATEPNLTRPSWSSLVNEVRVIYTRVVSGIFKTVPTQPIQDLAAQRNFGAINSTTVEFPAVVDVLLANSLGARTLRVLSTPLAQLTFKTSRVAADFKIGRPFRYSWALHGIVEHVFRVIDVDYGNLSNGQITVTAVEDIFALEQPFYGQTVDDTRPKQTYGVLGQVSVLPIVTSDGVNGYLELQVSGGNGRVTNIQFQEQTGNSIPPAFHDNTATTGVKTQVVLDAKHTSVIRWQILGTLPDGTSGELRAGEVQYPIAARPTRPALSYTLDGGTGEVTALVDVDSDAAYIRIAASTAGVPNLATVLATASIPVPGGSTRVTVADVIALLPDQHGYLSAVALDAAGNPSELASINLYFPDSANDPAVVLVRNDPSLTGQLCDVTLRVTSPLGLGGTLSVWLNHDAVANPAYSDAPDGSIVLGATPANPGPADVFNKTGGGTALLLHSIVTHPTKGKLIFAEFVDSNGRSSGQQSFLINGDGGPINNDGSLKDGSITNAALFAAGLAPVEVYPEPLPLTRPVGTVALDTTDLRLYKWSGAAWVNVVNTTDLSGTIAAGQIAANAVTAGTIAAGAVSATAIAAGAVTADKISVLSLSSISTDMGIVVSGKFQSALTSPQTVIDMGATGTSPVMVHYAADGTTVRFGLYADGSALFSGQVTWNGGGGVVRTLGDSDIITAAGLSGATTGTVLKGTGTGVYGWDPLTLDDINSWTGKLDWSKVGTVSSPVPAFLTSADLANYAKINASNSWALGQTFPSVTVSGGSFSGDGGGLTNLQGAQVVGSVATAGSAAALTTPRTIAGTSFNGTANIGLLIENIGGSTLPAFSGAALTNLAADAITTGFLADARIPVGIARTTNYYDKTTSDSRYLSASGPYARTDAHNIYTSFSQVFQKGVVLNASGGVGTSTLATDNFVSAVAESYMGSNSTYKVLGIGLAAGGGISGHLIALGYDPSSNAGGAYSGAGNEVLLPQNAALLIANSGNTSYWNVLSFSSSDGHANFPNYIQISKDGSATAEAGPGFEWTNAAKNRAWICQLDNNNGLTWFNYNGTSWVSQTRMDTAGTIITTNLLANGSILQGTAAGSTYPFAAATSSTGTAGYGFYGSSVNRGSMWMATSDWSWNWNTNSTASAMVLSASGTLSVTGEVLAASNVRVGAGNAHYWSGRTALWSPADGKLLLQNAASTDFSMLQFGGTSASFPAFKRSGTTIQARLADDTGYATLLAQYFQAVDHFLGQVNASDAFLQSNSTTTSLQLMDSAGTVRGWFYASTTLSGLLDPAGNWRVQTYNGGGGLSGNWTVDALYDGNGHQYHAIIYSTSPPSSTSGYNEGDFWVQVPS